jgi:hypothetical protein
MSLAEHPDIGPVAEALLDELKKVMAPGDSPMDMGLVCIAVAAALIVESAAEAPETTARRLERAQAFLESMVDFHVARQTPLGEAARALVHVREVGPRNCVIRFPSLRRASQEGGDDAA